MRCLLLSFAFVYALSGLAQDAATVTLLKNTPLHIIRGYEVMQGAEGMLLRQGDVLQTGPDKTAQVQIELPGGAVVELGSSSQLFLLSTGPAAELILVAGWLKGETTTGVHRYASPMLTITTRGGNVLLHIREDAADVFVERGTATVNFSGLATITSSPDRIFFTRRNGKPAISANRPSEDFINSMPVCFRDALPPRLSHFAGARPPVPKRDHDVTFVEIEGLLRLPQTWRNGLVERFKPRLQDKDFRQAIAAHLTALPEWRPALYPDSYK